MNAATLRQRLATCRENRRIFRTYPQHSRRTYRQLNAYLYLTYKFDLKSK